MNQLVTKLKEISELYGIIGLKQSFEDEGAIFEDVVSVKRITELNNLQSFVKVGGCEANTDIQNCLRIGVNGIIAPMVETPFAVSKFMDCYDPRAQFYIVMESKTAYSNINDIFEVSLGKLAGVVVGRSDLSKSYNLDKNEADSDFIYSIVEDTLVKAKSYNLLTTLGGNVSVKSSKFVKKMYSLNLLNRIETRNVVIGLTQENIDIIDLVIQEAINYEILLLENKLSLSSSMTNDYIRRIDLLKLRK